MESRRASTQRRRLAAPRQLAAVRGLCVGFTVSTRPSQLGHHQWRLIHTPCCSTVSVCSGSVSPPATRQSDCRPLTRQAALRMSASVAGSMRTPSHPPAPRASTAAAAPRRQSHRRLMAGRKFWGR